MIQFSRIDLKKKQHFPGCAMLKFRHINNAILKKILAVQKPKSIAGMASDQCFVCRSWYGFKDGAILLASHYLADGKEKIEFLDTGARYAKA
ncbi:hypothetical protein TNIN_107741 [Trichonephila inaurata madagascariensis]|uniref:Uncharacterized protein n=1 Tax=Trichonephila inaurata madagascariensis TaxID=2747483 RepID=A0A8X7CHF4_9ARAC|nr:hypothetical protein TNIN_107741 [Trichonephila inaurata madagascariensis]